MHTFRFAQALCKPVDAVVLVYDLESFTTFANVPDVGPLLPKLLNHVSSAIGGVICGTKPYWMKRDEWERLRWGPLPPPAHEKFLGDGGLYIWTATGRQNELDWRFRAKLVERICFLRKNRARLWDAIGKDVPVATLPQRIRFGLASGTVYELRPHRRGASREYVGVSINLASRLQGFCAGLTFVASAKFAVPRRTASKHNLVQKRAKGLKGFPGDEFVTVDAREFSRLSADTALASCSLARP